jgi:hypothetical protein
VTCERAWARDGQPQSSGQIFGHGSSFLSSLPPPSSLLCLIPSSSTVSCVHRHSHGSFQHTSDVRQLQISRHRARGCSPPSQTTGRVMGDELKEKFTARRTRFLVCVLHSHFLACFDCVSFLLTASLCHSNLRCVCKATLGPDMLKSQTWRGESKEINKE